MANRVKYKTFYFALRGFYDSQPCWPKSRLSKRKYFGSNIGKFNDQRQRMAGKGKRYRKQHRATKRNEWRY